MAKQPVAINCAEVFIDSQFGPEGRTVLTLRFPTGEVSVDLSVAKAGRIRKLNRVALERQPASQQ